MKGYIKSWGKITAFALLAAGLTINSSCKEHNPLTPIGGPVQIYVVDTFSNKPLNNIPVTLKCNHQDLEGITQNGMVKFELESGTVCTEVDVNFTNSKGNTNINYIPSFLKKESIVGGEVIEYDIVKKRY